MKAIKNFLSATLILACPIGMYGQKESVYIPKFAIKTNTVYWATATANKEHPTVNFIFSHQMSKLTLVFQNGIDTEVSGITTYTLKGLKMKGTFDTGTGKAIAKEDANTENLTVATSGVISGSALPSLILYPQVITDKLELSIMNGGKSYSCDLTVTNNALANGKDYQYTITLTKEQLKVTSSSIEPWITEKHSGTATIE